MGVLCPHLCKGNGIIKPYHVIITRDLKQRQQTPTIPFRIVACTFYDNLSQHILMQLQYVWLHVVTESSSYTMSGVVHYTLKEEIRP